MQLGMMTMKVRFAVLAAFLLASAFPQTGHAQGPPPGQPYIQIPVPGIPGVGVGPPPPQQREYRGWREHCEHLRDREHELRDRLAYTPPYGEERGRLEHRLREVHYEREQCWRRLTKVSKKEEAAKAAFAVSDKFAVPRVKPLSPTATPTPINVRDFAS